MKFKIITTIETNKDNPEMIDCSIARVGRVPQKYGALALALQLSISEGVRIAMNPRVKKGATDGDTDNKQ